MVKRVLLWIALLPGAMVGSIAVYSLWRFLVTVGAGFRMVDQESIIFIIFLDGMSAAVQGAAFVYLGSLIAPSGKKTVATVLTGLNLVLSGASLFFVNFISEEYYSNLGIVATNLGAIACAYSIVKEDILKPKLGS